MTALLKPALGGAGLLVAGHVGGQVVANRGGAPTSHERWEAAKDLSLRAIVSTLASVSVAGAGMVTRRPVVAAAGVGAALLSLGAVAGGAHVIGSNW